VTNVSPDTTLEQLKDHFAKAGTIAFAKFTYKGFKMRKASIEYEKVESVKSAISQFNETKLHESELTVQEFVVKEKTEKKERAPRAKSAAEPKAREAKPKNMDDIYKSSKPEKKREPVEEKKAQAAQKGGVYIGNLSYSVTDKAFSDFVYGFGKIKEHFIQRDKRGRSKGFGIVVFRYPQDAEKAISELDGLELEGRKVFARSDKGDTTEDSFQEGGKKK